jgi:thiosulfate dehydrogenase [quinone] large subunit
MPNSIVEKSIVLGFRLAMAWTFLYSAAHQIFDPNWSVARFLSQTKTFHDFYSVFATPQWSPIMTVMVEYGHLLIGLSLLIGFMVRVSASFGILLMVVYWTAHMDFPYIENTNNFLLDYHLVYGGVLVYLIVKQAGYVWGVDGWARDLPWLQQHPHLRPLVA